MPHKRRRNGEGRVYEHPKKSGIWWAQLPEKEGKTGPRWRVSDRESGEAELRDRLRDYQAGIKIYDRSDTFGEWLVACIELDAASISPTTYDTYHQHARLYVLNQPIADILLADLDVPDVRWWLATIAKTRSKRTNRRLSPNTIRRAYNLIHKALLMAFDDRRISWLPPRSLRLPPTDETERRALTLEESGKLINAAWNLRLAMIYKTFIATGMRESELIGLQWRMIDWDHSQINLTSQLKWLRGDKRWERRPLKNRKRRLIPLDETLLDDLRAHRERQGEDKKRAGDEWQDGDLVFPTSKGTPFNTRNLIDDLQRDARSAGVGKVTVHELRHTAGSLLLQAGKTMTTVSKILGHSSVGVTDKIYAHAFDEDKRDAVAAVTKQLPLVEKIASERAIPQQTVRKPVRTQKNTESR